MASLTGDEANPTVKTVAAHAGVSAQTVSRVLRGTGYVSQQTREKVLAAVDAVGYRPNAVGRSLRATKTPMVGLLITDITNPFYARLHKAIEAVFRDHGLTLMLLNSDDDPDTERQQLDLISSYRPSALIAVPAVGSSLTERDLARFDIAVLVSRTLPHLNLPSVVTNEPEAMREATEALLHAGHRRIAAIMGPASASTTQRRAAGYHAAMAAADAPPLLLHTEQTTTAAREAIKQALRTHPDLTAAIGFNTPITAGILAGMRDEGLHCPHDLSLIGFTDAVWMEFYQPPITVVRQPVEEMGTRTADLVLDLLGGKQVPNAPQIIPSQLLPRESIAPPRVRVRQGRATGPT